MRKFLIALALVAAAACAGDITGGISHLNNETALAVSQTPWSLAINSDVREHPVAAEDLRLCVLKAGFDMSPSQALAFWRRFLHETLTPVRWLDPVCNMEVADDRAAAFLEWMEKLPR